MTPPTAGLLAETQRLTAGQGVNPSAEVFVLWLLEPPRRFDGMFVVSQAGSLAALKRTYPKIHAAVGRAVRRVHGNATWTWLQRNDAQIARLMANSKLIVEDLRQ